MVRVVADGQPRRRVIAAWLFLIAAMVFAMVVLGGVTRLTHSGLSMVEWRPLTGWLPPLGEAEWRAAFAAYQQSPEFRHVNPEMTLAGFKGIFWLEYLHRVWGRVIGIAFFVPFVAFALRGWLDRALTGKLMVAFVLGALQGVLGWAMVKSGLVDRPDVSQYRLTAHLGAALVIYAYLIWLALGLIGRGAGGSALPGPWRLAAALTAMVFVTILSGGFVAGLDAGLAYNTFPLMDGRLIPEHLFAMRPFWLSLFEDVTTVQFDHRVLAIATLLVAIALSVKARGRWLAPRGRVAVWLTLLAAALQVTLGVATLLAFVPIPLAAAHQANAVILFTMALWATFELRAPPRTAMNRQPAELLRARSGG